MKNHNSKDGTRSIWFDTHVRIWNQQTLDADGNQVGMVDYTGDRWVAFAWLAGKSFSQIKLMACEKRAKLSPVEATKATKNKITIKI